METSTTPVVIKPLTIQSQQGDYEVMFCESIPFLVKALNSIERSVIAIDQKVYDLYQDELSSLLKSHPFICIPATEEEKTLSGVEKLATWLQKNDCNRQSNLIAIGGGIIQDICSLTAHLYYRGIPWTFVPTTLLSMSDSCIGAKCGINLNEFKNQLGSFQSPAQVLIATDFIQTLEPNDVSSGYGEILKLSLTGSKAHFDQLHQSVKETGLKNKNLLKLIRDSLEVKKNIIEEDEYEKNLRRILNFGHTFGHALESITSHEIPHGLAVAWGIDLVNFISHQQGLLTAVDFFSVHHFIKQSLPFKLSRKISAIDLIQGSRRDKKNTDGQLNLVLMQEFGNLKIHKTPFDSKLESIISKYLETHNVYMWD